MVFVTGDVHFPTDAGKLFKRRKGFSFPALRRTDYLIVLGDFGLFWSKKNIRNKENMERIQKLPYTLLFVDGNHENFDWLEEFPVEEMFGGKVHRCGENIFHLMRGQVFSFDSKKVFVCGGAFSVDKELRILGVSWWPHENISYAEIEEALDNLEQANYNVDYILTHTCPQSLIPLMFRHFRSSTMQRQSFLSDPTAIFLDEVQRRTEFREWYFGHWHEDKDYGKFHCRYNTISILK